VQLYSRTSFDRHATTPIIICRYWDFRDEIHEAEGLPFVGERLIVPEVLKRDMLVLIHEGHLGIEKSNNMARPVLFCQECQRTLKNP
jgi:hypothetical protein